MIDRPIFVLRLRPLPGSVPTLQRLKRCLKALLRAFRLECVSITEEQPAGESEGP